MLSLLKSLGSTVKILKMPNLHKNYYFFHQRLFFIFIFSKWTRLARGLFGIDPNCPWIFGSRWKFLQLHERTAHGWSTKNGIFTLHDTKCKKKTRRDVEGTFQQFTYINIPKKNLEKMLIFL